MEGSEREGMKRLHQDAVSVLHRYGYMFGCEPIRNVWGVPMGYDIPQCDHWRSGWAE